MDFVLSNIIAGVIAGIIASITLSFLILINKPKIKVSKKIAEENGKFRCKIQNNSNRDIGDTYIRVTYRTTSNGTHTYTTYCPILHGKKVSKDSYYNETRIRFKDAVWKSNNDTLTDRIELSMKDFFALNSEDNLCCVELEISYYDYNLVYGAVRRFITQRYTYNSIEFNSVFPKGSLRPIPVSKKTNDNTES